MYNPNKNFQQQQNQAQQKQFQNAFNQANKFQQQQSKQTAARWNRQSRERQSKLIQAGYQRNRAAEAIWRRRKASSASHALPAGFQPELGSQNVSAYRCQSCDAPISAGNALCTNCGVPVQQPRPAQSSVERHSSWRKSIGIMVLIGVAVLVLGAIVHARSSPVTQAGTPGVISVGANIRTGPGTENSIAATAAAGTRIIIGCRITTPQGYWDRLTSSPYQGLYVSATLVNSHRPADC